ncbi:hypothetical protein C8F01DRAFT_1311424 [Mycena amicta]|nr:hypothetical protein C8F01DRAFT_1311424 [Mycena amicta]
MLSLGLKDLPSDRVMDDIDKALQPLCGIQSIRYSGKLGHTYYTNDFTAIITQHLHFLPEDSGNTLSEAWQAARWRHELDPDLATPMICLHGQDFYIHEPAILHNGNMCMPTRWFKRSGKTYAPKFGAYNKQQTGDDGSTDFMLAFPAFIATFRVRNLPDPRNIYGIRSPLTPMAPWTLTDPTCGNRWRKQSNGHRVVTFPVWLYCDDTSGNTSKKWNKHNSFLFTAAGLPQRLVHLESNIHFLSTSNIAPPLEMLDGIVDQLCAAQTHGIWAWDSLLSELVLVILSVLAMLGDNPMQSEFTCHIGFRGKFFCRVCRIKGDPKDEDDGEQEAGSDAGSDSSAGSGCSETGTKTPKKKKEKKKKNPKKRQTVAEMVSRITKFMTDTPVKILHVILLGFVKYFWRDVIARLKPPEKAILSNRLSSFNVSGLGISPLSGRTLVDYSGSLTGRDFRAIMQAAPFVLHGLLSKERIHAWAALAVVVYLVRQPEIRNLDAFMDELEKAIDHLLNCTCILSLNWFNKPKFHVILHLPMYIRRFGPAMLFTTEGFELYNAIIRACSVHSNRHAPSRDIAWQMAQSNPLPTEPQSIDADSPWMKIPPAALKESKWFSAGKGPRALLARDSFGARFFGIKEDDASEPAGCKPGLYESPPRKGLTSFQPFPAALWCFRTSISALAQLAEDPSAPFSHSTCSLLTSPGTSPTLPNPRSRLPHSDSNR